MRARTIAALAAAAAAAAWAVVVGAASEEPLTLSEAPGRDLVEARCVLCHSLDYIPMNAPLMTPASWEKTMTKMVRVMGAPVTEEEARIILEYLDRNYAGGPGVRAASGP